MPHRETEKISDPGGSQTKRSFLFLVWLISFLGLSLKVFVQHSNLTTFKS